MKKLIKTAVVASVLMVTPSASFAAQGKVKAPDIWCLKSFGYPGFTNWIPCWAPVNK